MGLIGRRSERNCAQTAPRLTSGASFISLCAVVGILLVRAAAALV